MSSAESAIPLGSKTRVVDYEGDHSNDYEFGGNPVLISVSEAESIVESLESFTVEDIGSSPFLHMYGYQVERLSLQAHATAKVPDCGDEYVVEAILTFGKIPTLVRTLISIELWRTMVLNPKPSSRPSAPEYEPSTSLLHLLAKNGNSLRTAFTLHTETTLVCLLNLILYRKEGCIEMDSETAVALVDYCARQLVSYCL